jgi:hypothetical protein
MDYSDYFSKPRYDFYRATFDDMIVTGRPLPTWQELVESLADYFPLAHFEPDASPVAKQATKGIKVTVTARPLLRMCWGGSTFGDRVFVQSEGQSSHQVYEWLTDRFSGMYSCSRVDVCMDTVKPSMFPIMVDALSAFALEKKISVRNAGDWSTGDPNNKGKTLYVGAKRPSSFIRLYEKGKQLNSVANDWVRFEAEISPEKKAGKRYLAMLSPAMALHTIPWISSFLFSIGIKSHTDIQTISKEWKQSVMQKSLIHMVSQYKRHLREFAASLPAGSYDLGTALLAMADIHDAVGNQRGGLSLVSDNGLGVVSLNPYDDIFELCLNAA